MGMLYRWFCSGSACSTDTEHLEAFLAEHSIPDRPLHLPVRAVPLQPSSLKRPCADDPPTKKKRHPIEGAAEVERREILRREDLIADEGLQRAHSP